MVLCVFIMYLPQRIVHVESLKASYLSKKPVTNHLDNWESDLLRSHGRHAWESFCRGTL